MTNPSCPICLKRILGHERTALCTLCQANTHKQCLPNYNPDDFIYATNTLGNWTCPTCLESLFPFFSIEDNNHLHITINNDNNIAIDLDLLQTMVYDPLDDTIGEGTGVLDDIDPDNNYLNELRGNQAKIASITSMTPIS